MDINQAFQAKAETVVLKAGTIVRVGGFPFRLVADTTVEGVRENLNLIPLTQSATGLVQGGGSGG